MNIETK
jgi:hypothetical protein